MAVSPSSASDSKPLRKLSLSYIKEAIAQRASRSRRGQEEHTGSEDPRDSVGASCSSSTNNNKVGPNLLRLRASKHGARPWILKSLGRRFKWKSGASKGTLKAHRSSAVDRVGPREPAGSCPYAAIGEELPDEELDGEDQKAEDCETEEEPRGHSLSRELSKLCRHGWYWGPISREEAEQRLRGQADGSFLLRDSSAQRFLLSLSFRSHGHTLHTRIHHSRGLFSFYAQEPRGGFPSVGELVQHSLEFSQGGVFCYSRAHASPAAPSFPVRLTRPVSRFTQVRSLQYLCRFVIRQCTRLDNIQKLPLPPRLQSYVQEAHY